MFDYRHFSVLFLSPPRNGIYKSKDYLGSGVKLVRMGELFSREVIDGEACGFERIQLTDKEKMLLLLQSNDLLFSRTSVKMEGVGKCSVVRLRHNELTFDSNIIRVRLDCSTCDPRFYFYYFQSVEGRDSVRMLSSGVAVTTITSTGLGAVKVPCPKLEMQRKIASILSAYDDLIENNTRRIKILEEMAQMIYREWFVNFRFPGHEHVRMVESELGPIPDGWKPKRLGDLCHEIRRSVDPPK